MTVRVFLILPPVRDVYKRQLTKLSYPGDTYADEFDEWAEQYDADEAIVILSSFDVDSSGGDGSLNPDSTYDDWKWILIRNDSGNWEHVDHGY